MGEDAQAFDPPAPHLLALQLRSRPPVRVAGRRIADHDRTASHHESERPVEHHQWGTGTAADGGIELMGVITDEPVDLGAVHLDAAGQPEPPHRPFCGIESRAATVDQDEAKIGTGDGDHQTRDSWPGADIDDRPGHPRQGAGEPEGVVDDLLGRCRSEHAHRAGVLDDGEEFVGEIRRD